MLPQGQNSLDGLHRRLDRDRQDEAPVTAPCDELRKHYQLCARHPGPQHRVANSRRLLVQQSAHRRNRNRVLGPEAETAQDEHDVASQRRIAGIAPRKRRHQVLHLRDLSSHDELSRQWWRVRGRCALPGSEGSSQASQNLRQSAIALRAHNHDADAMRKSDVTLQGRLRLLSGVRAGNAACGRSCNTAVGNRPRASRNPMRTSKGTFPRVVVQHLWRAWR
mmetsp:Transcript_9987/g.26487  ORF Transcript_9987/g.26487 Transcript_9987/m.26487 type:complete len:221 (+) Transcript_9987:90-752(+)